MIHQDIDWILCCIEALQSAEVTPINSPNTEAMLKEYHNCMRNTVVSAVVPITTHLEALEQMQMHTPLPLFQVATSDHEALVHELHATLMPHIVAMCSEPVDYELLTEQLSQSVKHHISQLIDLVLDKWETAGLIERLIPVLLMIYPPAGSSVEIPAFIAQVTASKSVFSGLRS